MKATEEHVARIVNIPTRIDKVCAKASGRYAVTGPQVQFRPGRAPIAQATDGHALAVVACDGLTPDDAEPLDVIIPDTLINKRGKVGTRLSVNGTITNANGISADPMDGTFPPTRDVVPAEMPKPVDRVLVSLDARLLLNLANAIGSDGVVTLAIRHNGKGDSVNKPIQVLPPDDTDTPALGVLMPCSTGKDQDIRWRRYWQEFFSNGNK